MVRVDGDSGSLKLVEGDGIPENVTYFTLSHCRGNIEDKIVLTLENKSDWKTAIPSFGSLKTFQDAVIIARRLGLSYIWIDSLCIIQDCKEDWLVESKRMSSVYKYSLCNITATSAKSDSEGCFFTRSLRKIHVNPIRIYFSTDSATDGLNQPSSAIRVPSRPDSPRTLKGTYELFESGAFDGWSRDVISGEVNHRA